MRTIDEIYKQVNESGMASLEPDELEAYVENERTIAARDAAFAERQSKMSESLDKTAEEQMRIADAAITALNDLISNRPTFEVLE